MISNKLFQILLSICLAFCLFSCESDEIGPDDIAIPELTTENTIQFTVKTDKRFQMEVVALGGRTAIDWGDGHINKYSAKRMQSSICSHIYQKTGTYTVKVLCDETVTFNISGLLQPISELKLGNCPKLETLNLNTISGVQSFVVDNCPKLTNLNIGNWPDLTSLDLSACTEIRILDCYTHPNLQTLNLDNNKSLTNLNLSYIGITGLKLENRHSLTELNCDHNQLTGLSLIGNYRLKEVNCSNNKLSALIIDKGTSLIHLIVNKNELATIDLSEQKNLNTLICSSNKLAVLDITNNIYLQQLRCSANELTNLDVSKNTKLTELYCGKNKLEADALNTLFKDLPLSKDQTRSEMMPSPVPKPSVIQFYKNPGTTSCDSKIITDKGWILDTKEDPSAL